MLNVTRQQARRMFYALIAVLVFVFILIIWLFARTAAPALEPILVLLDSVV